MHDKREEILKKKLKEFIKTIDNIVHRPDCIEKSTPTFCCDGPLDKDGNLCGNASHAILHYARSVLEDDFLGESEIFARMIELRVCLNIISVLECFGDYMDLDDHQNKYQDVVNGTKLLIDILEAFRVYVSTIDKSLF